MIKKMNRKIVFLMLLAVGFIALTSCERDDICPEGSMTTPSARLEFYNIENGREETIDASSLKFYGMAAGDTLFSSSPSSNHISLPVDFEHKESVFLVEKIKEVKDPSTGAVIDVINLTDTLTLKYEPVLTFISKACGYCFTYKNITMSCTTGHSITGYEVLIEGEPSYGELLSSRQVVAKIYIDATE